MLGDGTPLAEINARLARHISKVTGYMYPVQLVQERLRSQFA